MFQRTSDPVPIASAPVGRAAGLALGAALIVALAGVDPASAQTPAPTKATPAAPATTPAPAAAAPAAPTGPAYTYDAAGRRDPFVSLDRASDPKGSARGKSGLSMLTINEATVKGVVKSQGRLVAMVQSPDNKTYIVRPNDRLLDGAVRAVTPEAVVFVQHVNDPLSLVKQREIRKPLRILEEDK